MITLQEWLDIVEYRISEGGEYWYDCYGENAYFYDTMGDKKNDPSFFIVFNPETQEVYHVEAVDRVKRRCYRLINPNYKPDADVLESQRNAYDLVDLIDLEVDEDWLEKAQAITKNQKYDSRISVPLELPEEELMLIYESAHKADMTVNQFVEKILLEEINRRSK